MQRGLEGWLVLVAAAAGCGAPGATTTDAGDAGGAADAAADAADAARVDTRAHTLTHRAGPWMLEPGQERTSDCESWTLHNEEPLYVNVVEMSATPGMHHSNWFFVPDDHYAGPDGTWRCSSRNFDQGTASALGGVFFAQSTQVTADAQRFPSGTAFVVPPHARVIGQLHQLNASGAARAVSLELTVRTLPRSEVRTRLSPFYLEYGPLEIPPRSRSRFEVDCLLDERARIVTGMPLSLRFFYGLAHYHEMGSTMRVTTLGGATPGRALYETDARQGDSWARTMSPPTDVTGATGLRLSCEFENTTSRTVRYGNGDGEMCIWFGFTDSPLQWAARAPHSARGTRGESRDGVATFTAPCTEVIALRSRHLDG